MTELPLLINVAAYSAQVLCIVALGGLLSAVLRINTPAVRHAYWRALVVVCIALPWLQGRQASTVDASAASEAVFLLAPGADTTGTPSTAASTAEKPSQAVPSSALWSSWPQGVIVLLAAGAALRLLWLAVGLMRLARLRHTGHAAELSESEEALRVAIAPRASVRDVPALRQPVTFGLLTPVVLLPESLRESDPDIRHAVLCHELHHVRRADWASVLIEELVLCALWFHPAAWWLVSRVQLSREEVVDELVVRTTGTRRTYIEALMLFSGERGLAPAPAFSRRQHLFRRIVLLSKDTRTSMPRLLSSVCAWAVAIGAGVWLAAERFPLSASAEALPPLDNALPKVENAPLKFVAPDVTVTPAVLFDHRPLAPDGRLVATAPPALTTSESPVAQSGAPVPPPANPGTALPSAPRQTVRVPVEAPPEMTAIGAQGVVLVRLSIDASGRVVNPQVAGYALSTSNPSKYRAVQEEPLPPVESVFPGDPVWQAAAEAMNRVALTAARQFRYEAPRTTAISGVYAAVMVPSLEGFVLLSASRPAIPPVDPSLFAASGGPGIGAITGVDSKNLATVDSRLREVARLAEEQARRTRDVARNGAGQSQGGAPGPSPEAIAAGTSSPTLAVAPPPPPRPVPDGPIRVGGNVQAPKKIKDVKPAYPEEARANRVQGIIILEIVIAPTGRVVDARVLRSIHGLDDAALDAVKQWEFTPTLLNGVPVAIVMSVTVNFTMN